MLHSLVRVSRRVGCSHLSTNNLSARRGRPRPSRLTVSGHCTQSPPRGPNGQRRPGPKEPVLHAWKFTAFLSRLQTAGGTSRPTFWARSNCCWTAPQILSHFSCLPSLTYLSWSSLTATVRAPPNLLATILWQLLPGISGCFRFDPRNSGNPCFFSSAY